MSDEWGPWIEHDGKGCPCRGEMIEAVWLKRMGRNIYMQTNLGEDGVAVWIVPIDAGANPEASSWWWTENADGIPRCKCKLTAPLIRYRIRKPRGLTILENLIADLPAPTSPKVGA